MVRVVCQIESLIFTLQGHHRQCIWLQLLQKGTATAKSSSIYVKSCPAPPNAAFNSVHVCLDSSDCERHPLPDGRPEQLHQPDHLRGLPLLGEEAHPLRQYQHHQGHDPLLQQAITNENVYIMNDPQKLIFSRPSGGTTECQIDVAVEELNLPPT